MTKLDIAKAVVGGVVSVGISHIIGSIVANEVPQETLPQKGAVLAGKFALTMVVNDAVRERTDAKIDLVADWWKENVTSK